MIHHLFCENCAKEFTVETSQPWLDRPEHGFLCPKCAADAGLECGYCLGAGCEECAD